MRKANPVRILPGIKSSLIGIAVNLLLTAVKGIAGYFGNSFALISDAIESGSDVIISLLILWGIYIATKEPDEDHPYGHGKAEPLVGVGVGLLLIASSFIIAVETWKKIHTPHDVPKAWTLIILALVIFTKEVLFRYVFKIGGDIESSAIKADAWHHRSDAITSAAVFVGIAIALIGGKEYAAADDWAALVAAAIILYNAFRIILPSLDEIMDKAPSSDLVVKIKESASKVPDVKGLDKCLIRKMGFDYFVDLHVEVDGNLSVRAGHEIAHQVKEAILAEFPQIKDVLVHIEPF